MNLIEIILLIVNDDADKEETGRWLDDIGVSSDVKEQVMACLNDDGEFVYRDGSTKVFPLKHVFLEGEAEYTATIEDVLKKGNPVNLETNEELGWTGKVAAIIPTNEDDDTDPVDALCEISAASYDECYEIIEWYNIEKNSIEKDDIERLAKLLQEGRFHTFQCAECGEQVRYANPEDWSHFQGVRQDEHLGELCADCAALYYLRLKYAPGE